MNKQFVTYEIAMLLKELGFTEKCIYPYTKKKELFNMIFMFANFNANETEACFADWTACSAPLWSQAMDWIRNVHQEHINIWINEHDKYVVSFQRTIAYEAIERGLIKLFDTHEEAVEAAILYLLKTIKNENKSKN